MSDDDDDVDDDDQPQQEEEEEEGEEGAEEGKGELVEKPTPMFKTRAPTTARATGAALPQCILHGGKRSANPKVPCSSATKRSPDPNSKGLAAKGKIPQQQHNDVCLTQTARSLVPCSLANKPIPDPNPKDLAMRGKIPQQQHNAIHLKQK